MAANEWLAAMTRMRGKFLKKGLLQLLDNQPTKDNPSPDGFIKEFYKHPLLTSMMKDGRHPAYLSARTFAAIVTDVLTAGVSEKAVVADLGQAAAAIPDGDVKKVVMAVIQHAAKRNSEAKPEEALEAWFNDAMDRVSGWYKRRTQFWTVIVAVVITLAANADTVGIARRLWTDPVLRAAMVEGAKARAQKPLATIAVDYPDDADATVGTVTRSDNPGSEITPAERQLLGEVIGWRGVVQNNTWKDWGERGLGWFLTILALTMGAPFWFDLLNKFMNVRSAGKSPDESAKTPKK
jgi:hypothetical protein